MFAAVVAIVLGALIAIAIAVWIARAEARSLGEADPARNVDGLAAGILREIAMSGGAAPETAFEIARARTGWTSLPDEHVDITSWGEAFAEAQGPEERGRLLEAAVVVAMSTGRRIPATQYAALMALSFALGFHTDALARLRERHGFEYDDWARIGRPMEADRAGSGAPMFDRADAVPTAKLLAVLGLEESTATRQKIVSAYRHLAAESHPDRFHDATPDERLAASDRFRDLSAAYQSLMQVWERD
jgi:hypothetical protein